MLSRDRPPSRRGLRPACGPWGDSRPRHLQGPGLTSSAAIVRRLCRRDASDEWEKFFWAGLTLSHSEGDNRGHKPQVKVTEEGEGAVAPAPRPRSCRAVEVGRHGPRRTPGPRPAPASKRKMLEELVHGGAELASWPRGSMMCFCLGVGDRVRDTIGVPRGGVPRRCCCSSNFCRYRAMCVTNNCWITDSAPIVQKVLRNEREGANGCNLWDILPKAICVPDGTSPITR